MISSDLPELIGMCDRILVIHHGRLSGEVQRPDFGEERIMALSAGIEYKPSPNGKENYRLWPIASSVVTPNRGSLILQSLKRIVAFREFSLSVVLIVMGAAMAFASPVFLDVGNLQAILLALSVEATIAVGMMLLLISGGSDLSVGSILGFTGVVTGLALQASISTVPAILIGLLAALVVGLINGLLVAKMNINPFITTLGMSITIRGLLRLIAKGRAVLNLPPSFYVMAKGVFWVSSIRSLSCWQLLSWAIS